MSSKRDSKPRKKWEPPVRVWSITQEEIDRIRRERAERKQQRCSQCGTIQKPIPEFEFHEHGPMMACPKCRSEFF